MAAIDVYRKILEIAPDDRESLVGLGNVLIQSGREAEEYEEHKRALSLDPDYPETWMNVGDFLLSIGRADEALGEF